MTSVLLDVALTTVFLMLAYLMGVRRAMKWMQAERDCNYEFVDKAITYYEELDKHSPDGRLPAAPVLGPLRLWREHLVTAHSPRRRSDDGQ